MFRVFELPTLSNTHLGHVDKPKGNASLPAFATGIELAHDSLLGQAPFIALAFMAPTVVLAH
jgi:hypothetical protein